MPIVDGMNSDYISYFPLEEYIKRINLLPFLLAHLESTNNEFDMYMKRLSEYDEDYVINYWILSLYEELESNHGIENMKFDQRTLVDRTLFFETFNINNKRIHDLHNFVTKKEIDDGTLKETFDYRNIPVNISRPGISGAEEIFYRGANPEDVGRFMQDFIKIYKHSGTSLLFSNPFLSSALIHLLFVRIHPYIDGNGRTARVIHNIKFTEMINKLHGTRLKLSPLNLSKSILLNKITYHNRLNNIYFDNTHDTNLDINKWFDFILDMVDEQIHYANHMLDNMGNKDSIIIPGGKARNMRLSRFKK